TPVPASVSTVSVSPLKGQASPVTLLSEKVLVVEDDAGWRSILEDLLSDAGFQVRTSASFGDAFGYLRKEKFSLAVIDLSLEGVLSSGWDTETNNPNLDGYQLLAGTHASNIPTIVVSGITEPEEIQRIYSE